MSDANFNFPFPESPWPPPRPAFRMDPLKYATVEKRRAWKEVVPSVNANRPAFEHLRGNGMWRVQLPREEHLFRDEAEARKFAAENGVPT